MNARKIFLLVCFFAFSLTNVAQNWQWSRHIGSWGYDASLGTSDKEGNFTVAGYFSGSHCYFTDTTLLISPVDDRGLFMAKYNSSGEESWVKEPGFDSPGEYSGFGDLIVDNLNNLYLTGQFYDSLVFDSIVVHSSSRGDLFVAKFSPDGSCLWATTAGGVFDEGGSGLAVDSAYNVYVCGINKVNMHFDSVTIVPGGFIAKYDSEGHFLWAKNKSSYNAFSHLPDYIMVAMTISKTNLYTYGHMTNDTISIDTVVIANPKGFFSPVICCYDLDANLKWVQSGITKALQDGENLSVDPKGNLYVTGRFQDSISLGGTVLRNPGKTDAYFCKFSKDGNLLWARQTHASGGAFGSSIVAEPDENFYLTGWFEGTAQFGDETIQADSLRDLFLARYDSSGNCTGIVHFGNAEGVQLGLDADNNPYLTGLFTDDVSIGQNTYSSYGKDDIFIARCDRLTDLKRMDTPRNNSLHIYANPNTGKCSISVPEEFKDEKALTLTIYDNHGRVIQSAPLRITEGKVLVNITAQASGTYNAVLTNGKKSYTGKIVFNAD